MIIDARNGFNDLRRFVIMWTVRHYWPAGARFAFNFYRHWAKLLLRQTGGAPVTILSREGVTPRYPILMSLYSINLIPLSEELIAEDSGILSLFYADDAVFNCLAQRSANLLKLLMERGADRDYFSEPDKSLFILGTPGQEEVVKR